MEQAEFQAVREEEMTHKATRRKNVCKACGGKGVLTEEAKAKAFSSKRGKQKRLEMATADAFANWTGLKFRRTPNSGGLSRGSAVDHFNIGGDIMCADKSFCFTVECKNSEDMDLEGLWRPKSPILRAWHQCYSSDRTKIPVLVVTKNRWLSVCIVRENDYKFVCTQANCESKTYFTVRCNKRRLAVIPFDDFFQTDYKVWAKVRSMRYADL